jgi:GxxExxY protein
MDELNLDKVTEKIIGCAYQVSNTLGMGFVEKVYENAHVHEMRKGGSRVQQQYPIKVIYDGISVGEFFADVLVTDVTHQKARKNG